MAESATFAVDETILDVASFNDAVDPVPAGCAGPVASNRIAGKGRAVRKGVDSVVPVLVDRVSRNGRSVADADSVRPVPVY